MSGSRRGTWEIGAEWRAWLERGEGEGGMTHRIRDTRPESRDAARQLRQRATHAEQLLWTAIRSRQLAGLKFRRQHVVGPFVVDFFCPAHRLGVELDGGIHAEQSEQDRAPTDLLVAHGYRVVRFPNEAVLLNLTKVLESIAQLVPAALPGPNR